MRAVCLPSPMGLLEARKELFLDAGHPKTPPRWRSQDECQEEKKKAHLHPYACTTVSFVARSLSHHSCCTVKLKASKAAHMAQ